MEIDIAEVSKILRNLHEPEKWQDSKWLTSSLVKNHLATRNLDAPSEAFAAVLANTLSALTQENMDYGTILRQRYWDGLSVHQMLDKAPYYWQERNFYILQNKAVSRFTSLLLEKEKSCQQAAALQRKIRLGLVALVFWVGIVLAVIFGVLLFAAAKNNSMAFSIRPMIFHQPSPTSEFPKLPDLLERANMQTVFAEDFEGSWDNGFTNQRGLWTVVSDGSENQVLDVNSMDTSIEYPVIDFGDPAWQDVVLQTRLRILNYVDTNDAPLASIRFRGKYKIALTPYWKSVELVFDPPWEIMSARTIEIHKNRWYSLLIYTIGRDVYVFLDEILIIRDTLNQDDAGEFGFATWPGAHVQFDDLFIRLLKKP